MCACALTSPAGAADLPVRLEQINARRAPDFSPVLDGRQVLVEGRVEAAAIPIANYAHLAIQDDAGHGAVVEGSARLFSAFLPGDRIVVRGTVSKRAGLPVIVPTSIEVLSAGPAPAPKKITVAEAQNHRALGLIVVVEDRVIERGETSAGEYLLVGKDPASPLKIVLPTQRPRGSAPRFSRIDRGDKVRATGLTSQHCTSTPYDHSYEIVVAGDDAVALVQKRWLISPETLAAALGALVFALAVWWTRERRMAAQRRMVRTVYGLGEEMTSAGSPADIVRKLASALPAAVGISGVHLYLYNRANKMLDRVPAGPDEPPFALSVFGPEGTLPAGPAVSFRNQALMTISDTRRSPFFPDGRPEQPPRSVAFIPLFAESEAVGVLEFYSPRATAGLSTDEKVLAQHLANQIAIALRLMEEKSIREQLFRSEKLAAVGRLITGVASELKAPLESITQIGESLEKSAASWADVRTLSAEARKASDIVSRLVAFMQPARAEARRIDLNGLLHSLIEFRREHWRERGITIHELLCPYPVPVLGSQGQLERVFLDLLIQAEQAVADTPDRTIHITSGLLARRVIVEIGYGVNPAKTPGGDAQETTATVPVEGLTRGIVTSHGGDVRMVRSAAGDCRIEVELPLTAEASAGEPAAPRRQYTCLVVEPDVDARGQLTKLLTNIGCRVIPANSAEEGVELVQRLRFDVIFCAINLPGLNWIHFSEIVRPNIGAFVLLTEGFGWELTRGLVAADCCVLAKPVEQDHLDRVLATIETRLAENRGLQIVRPPQAMRAAK